MMRLPPHESDPESFFIEAARTLQMRYSQTVCVTLGKRGAVALKSGGFITIPGRAVRAVDTTGAGDCFVSALAAQIAAGATIGAALVYANVAACARSTRRERIRAIGVSNFSIDQTEKFRRFAPIHVLQPPYNLFEREIEAEILTLLPQKRDCDLRLRRVVPGPFVRTDVAGHDFQRR
jgi:hypothetical protein